MGILPSEPMILLMDRRDNSILALAVPFKRKTPLVLGKPPRGISYYLVSKLDIRFGRDVEGRVLLYA